MAYSIPLSAISLDSSGHLVFNAPIASGVVTSIAASVPAFLSISGSPITSSGTLAISLSGTALPIANGGTNSITALSNGKIISSVSGSIVESSISTSNVFLADGTVSATGAFSLGNNQVHNVADPTSAQDSATKNYVDNAVNGLDWKQAALLATTTALPTYTYTTGVITMVATGTVSVDGSVLALGNRILVKNETSTNQPYNGIYNVTTAGAVGVACVLTRSTDYNSVADIQPGDAVYIQTGTVNATTSWVQTQTITSVGGVGQNIIFVQSAGPGTIVINGTTNQIIASTTGNTTTLSTPQSIDTTSSPTFAALTLTSPLTVANGGTGDTSFTAYSVITGGTTSTGALQSVSGVGTAGQILTSNGASALPTWQTSSGSGTVNSGTTDQLAFYATTGSTVSGSTFLATNSNGQMLAPPTAGAITGYAFTSDANTGMYQTGAGFLGFAVSSTGVLSATNSLLTAGVSLSMGSNKIIGLATATTSGDALSYGQSSWSLAAGTLTGALAMGSNKITGLANGTAATDAAAFGQIAANGTVNSGAAGRLAVYPSSSTIVGDTWIQDGHNIHVSIQGQPTRSTDITYQLLNPGDSVATTNIVTDVGSFTITGQITFSTEATFTASPQFALVNSTGNATSIAMTTPASPQTLTIPDSGSGTANFVLSKGAQTISGALTLSNTLTMSGATIAMGSNKITGLANGTAATDAAAFGQIKLLQTIQATSVTPVSTTSSTFTAVTGFSISITPTSASNRIRITVSMYGEIDGSATGLAVTLKRGSTELSGASSGFALLQNNATGTTQSGCISFSFIDSPATTSSTTYGVFIRSTDNSHSVQGCSGGVLSTIIAEEIV